MEYHHTFELESKFIIFLLLFYSFYLAVVPKNGYKFGPPRNDKRCGSDYNADCIDGACCSAHGWCGSTKAHCDCDGCYRFAKKSHSKGKFRVDMFF